MRFLQMIVLFVFVLVLEIQITSQFYSGIQPTFILKMKFSRDGLGQRVQEQGDMELA